MKHFICIIFFVLTSTNVLFSQVSFEAKVSKKRLGLNERLRVDFVMNQDGDNFSPAGTTVVMDQINLLVIHGLMGLDPIQKNILII